MKNLLVFAFAVGIASSALADIQDPPSNDYGPTRKLGRGISNVLFGWSEIPHTIGQVNEREGNAAAGGYGVVRGVGRAWMRFHTGLFDIVTFPFPAVRGTYYPPLPDDKRYIHAGFQEFPPELGYESKYHYVRHY
jgi:putative exosortase-associated protein (TIGR04073 family)